jgi:hypothetical protein
MVYTYKDQMFTSEADQVKFIISEGVIEPLSMVMDAHETCVIENPGLVEYALRHYISRSKMPNVHYPKTEKNVDLMIGFVNSIDSLRENEEIQSLCFKAKVGARARHLVFCRNSLSASRRLESLSSL